MNLERIKEYVKEKHAGQTRKQGTPYYFHPFAVQEMLAKKGYSEECQAAGLCHDLLEDTDATETEILALTNSEVLEAVKLADRLHNLQEATLASKLFQMKYEKETKQWYLELAKGTSFEEEIQRAYQQLKEGI